MNGWEWAIPVIGVVIWIVANVARGKAEAARKPQALQRPAQRPRPASSDLDRFLEEINRQRQRQQQPKPQPAEEVLTLELDPGQEIPVVQAVKETRKQNRQRGNQRQRNQQSGRGRKSKQGGAVPQVIPLPHPQLLVEMSDADFAKAFRTEPSPITAGPKGVKVPTHLPELRTMLGSSTGVRAAFVLAQILGEPRCRQSHFSPRGWAGS